MRKYFPSFFHEYEEDKKSIKSLNDQISTLTTAKNSLEEKNSKLKTEIESLQNKLNSSSSS